MTMSSDRFNPDVPNQTYVAPPISRETSIYTGIPEEQNGHTVRSVQCSCGMTYYRNLGTPAIQCGNCGRKFAWQELKATDQFMRV